MVGSGARVAALVVAGILCVSVAVAIALVPAHSITSFGVHAADLPPRTRISPINYTLHGNAGLGWGFSNATIHEPGPPIVVLYNTNVTLTLIGHDSAPHNWFIDFNNDLTMSPGEPSSKDFNVPGDMVGTFPFVASQT